MTQVAQFLNAIACLNDFDADFQNRVKANDCSVLALEVDCGELESLWAEVKSLYSSCRTPIENACDDPAVGRDVVKAHYREGYATYRRCLVQLRELAQVGDPLSSTTNLQEAVTQAPLPVHHGVALPPCDTDIFHGDYLSWPSFRDMFTAVYISNPRLAPVEKLFHLNKKTAGEAKDIVKKSPLTNEGFAQAWKNLSDRFENKRILVNSQLKILFSLPPVTSESGKQVKSLQNMINDCVDALKVYDIDILTSDIASHILVYLCSTKLPTLTLSLWEQSIKDKTGMLTWSTLNNFLTERYQTLEAIADVKGINASSQLSQQLPKSNQTKVRNFHNKLSASVCKVCQNHGHTLRSCTKFLKLNVHERMAVVKKHRLCFNCLSDAHNSNGCTSSHNCSRCQQRHHTLLHRDVKQSTSTKAIMSPPEATEDSPSTSRVVHSCLCSNIRPALLGTAMVIIEHQGRSHIARALIDPGSEGTFISEYMCSFLNLSISKASARISGIGNIDKTQVKKMCTFTLKSPRDPSFVVRTNALILPRIAGNLPTTEIHYCPSQSQLNLPLADERFAQSRSIDLLIGADIYPAILHDGIYKNVYGSLLAQNTVFGYVLSGPIVSSTMTNGGTVTSLYAEVDLDQQLRKFWELEELPFRAPISDSDRVCEAQFSKTVRRNSNGRYIVSLPFKTGSPHIECNRRIALGCFLRNEAKLNRNPTLKQEYDRVLNEYLDLGHMVKVSQPTSDVGQVFYLPHHAVLKPESKTTKVRVVFNASSTINDISLNDLLYPGPVLQTDLPLLLMKWRLFRFVFNADIEKMYRQILVDPTQTSWQRILFRRSATGPVEDFELCTVTFGVNCAPYLAIRTLLQLADDVKATSPLASNVLKHYMYVDDVLAGSHDLKTTILLRDELIETLSSAGFSLRKYTSNNRDILKDLPKEDLLQEDFLEFEDSSVAKTLGIRWNAKRDAFYFTSLPLIKKANYTKREVLSSIAKLFDPSGWLAPIVVTAKILMQQIWLDKTDWDEDIQASVLAQWKTFIEVFHDINTLQIPRWVNFTTMSGIQFHAFCDASEKAYAATLYIRCTKGDTVSSHLLVAKTKVAPVKTVSLPRLELCGAALLAEMVDTILPQIDIDHYQLFCWTDSTIVLAWLNKPACRWRTFVANRVSKIIEKTNHGSWSHVDSSNNPADLGTRGATPKELQGNSLWWHGPVWLQQPMSQWPSVGKPHDFTTSIEEKTISVNFVYFNQHEDVTHRFSSLPRALRVLSYVWRFYQRCRRIEIQSHGPPTSSEINATLNRLIIIMQKVHFTDDYRCLELNETLSSKCTLRALNPFFHSDQLLRVGGRLVHAPTLSFSEKHPIILPYQCHLSRLLVKFIHEISLHGQNQLMLRLIRLKYWIPRGKNLVKGVIHNCKVCVTHKKIRQQQLMAALPRERTELSRPFTTVGIDFTGPFDIRNYTGRACLITKGYVTVFVCFATRAIHLECTSDLSSASFLAAFTRFASRRGCPAKVFSDNGTNFVGAAREIKENFKQFLNDARETVLDKYSYQGIAWNFIPPGAPHMGGLWEAGVKSFKAHFRKTAGQFKFTFEELSTLLSRIESCLNSRPLSTLTDNANDIQPLTPGHFLIGSPILAPPEPDIDAAPESIMNRWLKLKALHQQFARRWKDEYLKSLQKRHKWQTPQTNLVEGDVVIVRHEHLPPNEWRLGRIERVHPGRDGKVRIADVKTAKGCITRPIVKLVKLPSPQT